MPYHWIGKKLIVKAILLERVDEILTENLKQ